MSRTKKMLFEEKKSDACRTRTIEAKNVDSRVIVRPVGLAHYTTTLVIVKASFYTSRQNHVSAFYYVNRIISLLLM